MQIKEIYEKVSKMGLYVGDQVIVTNWIHKRLHLEILPSTFKNSRESNVRVNAYAARVLRALPSGHSNP